jgi:hypothetical protein
MTLASVGSIMERAGGITWRRQTASFGEGRGHHMERQSKLLAGVYLPLLIKLLIVS